MSLKIRWKKVQNTWTGNSKDIKWLTWKIIQPHFNKKNEKLLWDVISYVSDW